MIAGVKALTNSVYAKLWHPNEVERTPENSGLKPRQIATGRKALHILGIEEDGGLSKHQLNLFLYVVGLNPTDDIIDSKLRSLKLLELYENEEDSPFTFGHVCHVWNSMLQDLTDEEEILRRAFQFFDKDGNGELCLLELKTTMNELGGLLSEEEIQAFMDVMDVNKDGVIGFEEFLSTLRTQMPEMDMIQAGGAGGDFLDLPQPAEDGDADIPGVLGATEGADSAHSDTVGSRVGLIPAGIPPSEAPQHTGADHGQHTAVEMGSMEGGGAGGIAEPGAHGPPQSVAGTADAAEGGDASQPPSVRAPPGPLGEAVVIPTRAMGDVAVWRPRVPPPQPLPSGASSPAVHPLAGVASGVASPDISARAHTDLRGRAAPAGHACTSPNSPLPVEPATRAQRISAADAHAVQSEGDDGSRSSSSSSGSIGRKLVCTQTSSKPRAQAVACMPQGLRGPSSGV